MTFLLTLIASVLLLGTIVVELYLLRNASLETHQNRLRILSWWVIFAICAPIFMIGGWYLSIFIVLLALQSGYEAFGLFKQPFDLRHASLITFIAGSLLLLVQNPAWQQLFLLLSIGLLLSSLVGAFYRRTSLPLIIAAILLPLISLAVIGQYNNGGYLLLLLFFLTACNDIAQYLGGKLFGNYPLAPSVSPNKSIEGALTGLFVTLLLSLYFLQLGWTYSLLAGLLLGLAGIFGDLHISILKRHAGVKDSSTLIPGHGGLLDRLDSLLMTTPVFGLLLKALT